MVLPREGRSPYGIAVSIFVPTTSRNVVTTLLLTIAARIPMQFRRDHSPQYFPWGVQPMRVPLVDLAVGLWAGRPCRSPSLRHRIAYQNPDPYSGSGEQWNSEPT